MKSFFEKFRDDSSKISIRRNENHVYPLHFHSNLEVFIVKKGSYVITCNGKNYTLKENSVFVFDSFDIHSYNEKFGVKHEDLVLIIPYNYLGNFLNEKNGKRIVNPLIESEELSTELLTIINAIEKNNYPYKKGALVDLFLSTLLENLELSGTMIKNDSSVIRQILSYIELNFKENCSRDDIANALGYSNTYISKIFNRYINSNISSYVNTLRAKYVKDNLNKGKTVLELIYEAGFKSQQTYYRFIKNSKQS